MALKAEDCMLNNWVLKDGKYKQLKMCGLMDLHSFPSHFEGIPLDESVLLKCGATRVVCKKTGIRAQYSINGIKLDFSNSGLVYLSYRSMCIPFLHNLQNLFTALGQHLTFKP